MIEYNQIFNDNLILPFSIKPQNNPSRGQVQFCHDLIVNLIEKGISLCKQEFAEVQMKRKTLDHYQKDVCSISSLYGIFSIKSLKLNHKKHQIQTEDIDTELSNVFTDYIKSIQHQNSQEANSIFTNDVFSNIYSYLSILELRETQGDSPTQTSRHRAVKQEVNVFSKFLNTIRENLTYNDISQNDKENLQQKKAWIITDYFVHNLDLKSLARKKINHKVQTRKLYWQMKDIMFGTVHHFTNIPADISSQAITTVSTNSINRNFVTVTHLLLIQHL